MFAHNCAYCIAINFILARHIESDTPFLYKSKYNYEASEFIKTYSAHGATVCCYTIKTKKC